MGLLNRPSCKHEEASVANSSHRRRRLGCVLGIVSLVVVIIAGFLLSHRPITFYEIAHCPPDWTCPNPNPPNPDNPLDLPQIALTALFVLGAVGTVGSGVQTIWRVGSAIVRRLRGV
jgi:hypothetical protein